jgi:hypothetical protein
MDGDAGENREMRDPTAHPPDSSEGAVFMLGLMLRCLVTRGWLVWRSLARLLAVVWELGRRVADSKLRHLAGPKLLCAWPGLLQLWRGGVWNGLIVAVAFSVVLNGLLLTTLVWTEVLTTRQLLACWAGLVGFWLIAAYISWRSPVWSWRLPDWKTESGGIAPGNDLLPTAWGEYLRGNWFAAEAVCLKLLRGNPRDAEAQLLLATLFRRTARFDAAREQLAQLLRQEVSTRWQPELAAEMKQLDAAVAAAQVKSPAFQPRLLKAA